MLFAKELKKVCFSLGYFLFLILLVWSWYQNFYGVTTDEISATNRNGTATIDIMGGSILREPTKNDTSYGTKTKEVPERIMCGGTNMLLIEYQANSYATYPLGYYKETVLNDGKQAKILDILC